jgi:THO complex subunit 3
MYIHRIYVIYFRLEWPVRALSFSHDGKMLASASEDLVIDIAEVESGENRK